jgi:ribonuclease HI
MLCASGQFLGVLGPDADYYYRMSNLKPVTLHLSEDTLRRLKALAESRGTDHLTLAGEFVAERLVEEEELNEIPRSHTLTESEANQEAPPTGIVEIYTDGGCDGNPGLGGWAAVVIEGPKPKEISGAERNTTNNRMEIRAAIEGLKRLEEHRRVLVYSDSAYLVNCMNDGWYLNWQKNGWRTSAKKPVKNSDLWRELLEVARQHEVEWVKVEGHAGNAWNERAHALVQLAIQQSL